MVKVVIERSLIAIDLSDLVDVKHIRSLLSLRKGMLSFEFVGISEGKDGSLWLFYVSDDYLHRSFGFMLDKGTVDKLYEELKNVLPTITRSNLQDYLQKSTLLITKNGIQIGLNPFWINELKASKPQQR